MALATQGNRASIRSGQEVAYPVPNALTFFVGTMVAINMSTGILANAQDAQYLRVLGINYKKDITGTGNGETVSVHRGAFSVFNSLTNPVAATSIGGTCFVEDDTHVTTAAGTYSVIAGRILQVGTDDQGNAIVWIEPISELLAPVALAATATGANNTAILAAIAGITNANAYGFATSAAFTDLVNLASQNYVDNTAIIAALKAKGILR